jgi:hypothetical protein
MVVLRKGQAITLFLVSPIGTLGAYAFLLESPRQQNIPLGTMLATVSAFGFALGAWLWTRK